MKTKDFDAIEMKRRGAEAVLHETQGMTVEQELAHWGRRTEELKRKQGAARQEAETAVPAR